LSTLEIKVIASPYEIVDDDTPGYIWIDEGQGDDVAAGDERLSDAFVLSASAAVAGDLGNLEEG
jgi:hypothetical protein